MLKKLSSFKISMPKKNIAWIQLITQVILIGLLTWFYYDIYYNTLFSTFLFMFFIFPLVISIGIYYFLPISFIYAFAIGFLIQWVIFLNSNPYPLENNNKFVIMKHIPEKYKPEQEYLLKELKIEDLENMKYPIIIKPTVCTTGGSGIHIFDSFKQYVEFIYENEKKINLSEYMVQTYLEDYDVEIGVLYERSPWNETGKIIEIVEKTQKDKIRPLEDNFTKNHPELITEFSNQLFDELSKKIPGFYTGRYDIRLKQLEDLEKGEFKIVEANGNMGMDLLSKESMFSINDILIEYRWYWIRLRNGIYNIATFNGHNPLNLLRCMFLSIKNTYHCNHWESLLAVYS